MVICCSLPLALSLALTVVWSAPLAQWLRWSFSGVIVLFSGYFGFRLHPAQKGLARWPLAIASMASAALFAAAFFALPQWLNNVSRIDSTKQLGALSKRSFFLTLASCIKRTFNSRRILRVHQD
jgi:hypothetical protein